MNSGSSGFPVPKSGVVKFFGLNLRAFFDLKNFEFWQILNYFNFESYLLLSDDSFY